MKQTTKTIFFLIAAFIVIIIITASVGKKTSSYIEESTITEATSSPAVETLYTLAEVALHKTATDCWTAVEGGVFDLTPFVKKHPGGEKNITKICGIDGTKAFAAQHGSTKDAEKALKTLKIGILAK